MTVESVNGANGPKDTYYVSGGGQTNQSETTTNVDMSQAKGDTSEAGFAASGLSITKEDVKAAQDELGIRTSAKTKERVAAMRNEYAQKIMSYCVEGCPPELKGAAMAYVQELPMASRGRDLQDFKSACEAKLDAFRGTAQRMGLGNYLVQMEKGNQARFNLAETAADLRQTKTELTVVQTGIQVQDNVNAHSDELEATTQKVVRQEGRAGRAETRKQGRLTRGTVRAEGRATRANQNRNTDLLTRNMGAMIGTPGVGNTRTVTGEDGTERTVGVVGFTNGSTVDVEQHDTALGRSDANTDRLTKNVGSMLGIEEVGDKRTEGEGDDAKEVFVVTDSQGNETSLDPEKTVNGHTTAVGAQTTKDVNEHTTAETNRGIKTNAENATAIAGLVYGDNYETRGEGDDATKVPRINDGSGNYSDLDYESTIIGQTQNEGSKTRTKLDENTNTLKQQNEALKKKLEEALGLLRARGGNEGGSAPASEG